MMPSRGRIALPLARASGRLRSARVRILRCLGRYARPMTTTEIYHNATSGMHPPIRVPELKEVLLGLEAERLIIASGYWFTRHRVGGPPQEIWEPAWALPDGPVRVE